jgi:hypothetical protein
MKQTTLMNLLLLPTGLFVGGLALLILFRLVNGRIYAHNLLIDRESGTPSAIRLQMLMSTLTAVATYSIAIGSTSTPRAFPPVDGALLLMVGGSNIILLGKKSVRELVQFIRSPR